MTESVIAIAYLVILAYAVFAISQIKRILKEWYADHKRKETFYVERRIPKDSE